MQNPVETNSITDALFNRNSIADHGASEAEMSVLLQEYSNYVQSADKVSDRRQHANSFFLTVNTGVCIVAANLFSKDAATELRTLFWCVPVAGILVSYFWLKLVRSYRQLNSGKFKVIHLLESRLPCSPYKAEWIALGEGKSQRLYYRLTHLESWIPRLFILMYLCLIVYFVYRTVTS